MPRKIVAGNWKMNTTLEEAMDLVSSLKKNVQYAKAEVIICPPFPFIHPIALYSKDSGLIVGAQNCASAEKGAFTGEVSAAMLNSVGADCVIIGHSERRSLFGESNSTIKQKVIQAFSHQLRVVFCCGETLEERESGRLEEIISQQIQEGLPELIEDPTYQLVVAYEPVWAIGTGKTATATQAQEAHAFIRNILVQRFGNAAQKISILYGGSCNATNAAELFAQKDIDGGLIGGASLKAEDFLTITRAFQ